MATPPVATLTVPEPRYVATRLSARPAKRAPVPRPSTANRSTCCTTTSYCRAWSWRLLRQVLPVGGRPLVLARVEVVPVGQAGQGRHAGHRAEGHLWGVQQDAAGVALQRSCHRGRRDVLRSDLVEHLGEQEGGAEGVRRVDAELRVPTGVLGHDGLVEG